MKLQKSVLILSSALLSFAFSWADAAEVKTKLSEEVRRCVFAKPIEAGASVTGRVAEVIPVYAPFTSYFYDASSAPYKGSPSYNFIRHYREMGLTFAAPKFKVGDGVIENISSSVTNRFADIGSGQVESLLAGRNKNLFEKSSVLVGIDLFYWDAIWNTCGYGQAKYYKGTRGYRDEEVRRADTEYQIERLVMAAKAGGKTLVLGTVPQEDPSKVKVYDPEEKDTGIWFLQTPACIASINKTLERFCTIENRCYLMNFSELVQRLNAGEKFRVGRSDKEFGLYDMRPDGVHLSEIGSLYLFEKMVEKFEANPPTCAK